MNVRCVYLIFQGLELDNTHPQIVVKTSRDCLRVSHGNDSHNNNNNKNINNTNNDSNNHSNHDNTIINDHINKITLAVPALALRPLGTAYEFQARPESAEASGILNKKTAVCATYTHKYYSYHICVCMYVCVYIYICIYIYTCVCAYTYICKYLYTLIYPRRRPSAPGRSAGSS